VAPPAETWLLVEAAGAGPAQVDECVAAGMLQGQAGGVGFRHELARLAVERTPVPVAGPTCTAAPWPRC
jgi:hypothetical protein